MTEHKETFPVSSPAAARRYFVSALKKHKRAAFSVLFSFGLSSVAGLVGPQVLGDVVQTAAGRGQEIGRVDAAAVVFLAALAVQSVATTIASRLSGHLAARLLATLRTEFVGTVLQLPIGVVEEAGTGELQTRASSDVEQLTWSIRLAVPQIVIAGAQTVGIVIAIVVTAPVLALALVPSVPLLVLATRWYLRLARPGYQQTMARWDETNARVQETAAGGRTIEALGLAEARVAKVDGEIERWIAAERYTLRLRTVYFPFTEACYVVPLVLAMLLGGLLHASGHVSIAAATACVLYVQLLIDPVDTVLSWLDELQLGTASLSRLLGVRQVAVAEPTTDEPVGRQLAAESLHYAYREGHEVLKGIDLAPRPGSRLVIVGPSGAGKSTLALLLSGVHPPLSGRVLVGGVEAHRLAPERLRKEVVLLTQEYHVFNATLRDNIAISSPPPSDEELLEALRAVEGSEIVARLGGLDARLGPGAGQLSPAEAQKLALARLVLADPHTLVLDEATALMDPRSARSLERSISKVLERRTVIAVAHRLHSVADADEIVVVDDGRIVERGSHAELLSAGGSYAALWRSWQAA